MSSDLLYEVRENTAFLTINRESRRNALTLEMIESLGVFLERADSDTGVRAVCLTGAGEKAFCSGADLVAALGDRPGDPLSGAKSYAGLLKRLSRFGKPLLARVNGPCLAGGLGLMLSCDIVVSRDDIFFSTPEVNVGVFPMMIGALLYRNVGRKKAVEMVLTGRRVPAPEAEKMGLITRAVAPEDLDGVVRETLGLLTSKSPIGIRIGKEAFRAMSEMPFEEAVDYLCLALGRVATTQDAVEGMRAFVEKRPPLFTGR